MPTYEFYFVASRMPRQLVKHEPPSSSSSSADKVELGEMDEIAEDLRYGGEDRCAACFRNAFRLAAFHPSIPVHLLQLCCLNLATLTRSDLHDMCNANAHTHTPPNTP